MATRRELIGAVRERYADASRVGPFPTVTLLRK